MATRAGITGRQVRLVLLTLVWAIGPGFISPPQALAAACGGLVATIDASGSTTGVTIQGTGGRDVIHGSPFVDLIDGMGGNDTICGDLGGDHISGGTGSDTIYGDGIALTGDLANAINGGPGVDNIIGGDGDDTISGGPGTDSLYGGDAGDDTIFGNDEPGPPARDEIDGGDADPTGDSCFPNGPDATPTRCP